MVSEKPPRRSRTNKEPVTIDLTAEETPAVAEPVRANDTDELVPPLEREAAEPAAPVDTAEVAAAAEATAEPETAKTDVPRFDDAADPAVEPTTIPEPGREEPSKPAADAADDEAAPPKSQPWQRPADEEPQAGASGTRQPQRSAPATTTLVAAGIFGGIVALLLAGSMQYAGYLPGATPPQSQDGADISAEIASLRQEVAALANRSDTPSDDLAARVTALESSAPSGDTGALTERLSTIEGEIASMRSTTQASNADLDQRLQQAEAQINDRGPEQQAARAVAAAALKGAIDRGGSFEAELQTYGTVAEGDPAIAKLQPFAAKGVLSRTELQRQASSVANAMIEAISQPDPDQGIASRLLSSAMSVVKVRKVGDIEGDTPDAVVARFEDRLRSGDLPAAAREWDTLPEPAKTASQSFKQELDARIQVEDLVGGTLTRAITGNQG